MSWSSNLKSLFSYNSGDFKWWFLNSVDLRRRDRKLGHGGINPVPAMAWPSTASRGRGAILGVVLGSLMVPATALVVPLFLLEHDIHLTNTYQGVILPLMVYPFGVYFMSIFSADAVPDTLIDSCRMDGAGEFRTFWQIGRPILMPGMVTLFLLSFIGTWNNYFLPLVLLGTESRFPLTVGLVGVVERPQPGRRRPAALPRGDPRFAHVGPTDAHPVPLLAKIRGQGAHLGSDRR